MTAGSINWRPRTLQEAVGIIEQLRQVVAEQQAQIAALQEQVAELQERLGENSQNSSRPPSSDGPGVIRPAKRTPSGRKPGGQPGHEGHQRELVREAEVDEIVRLKPRRCRRCGSRLHGADGAPSRHQVMELPPVRPHVTEYQLHTLSCARCGRTTTASLPEGVPRGGFGPRVQAVAAVCTGVYHLSRRTTVGLMADMFGVPMSLGALSACEHAVSEAVKEPVAEAHVYVQQQEDVTYADETGWRERLRRAWLWVAVSPLVTVFLVQAGRSQAAAQVLLGHCLKAILITDRCAVYGQWAVEQRQLCWAHLLRDFTAFTERRGPAAEVGLALLAEAKTMFAQWDRVRAGTLSRRGFWLAMCPLRKRVEDFLRQGEALADTRTARTCRNILKLRPALWTFIDLPGVEPTNNTAERAARRAVLWRKRSFGSHSAAGSRYAERMLTVAATLTQQSRNVLDYLTQSSTARLLRRPAPSLLPDVA